MSEGAKWLVTGNRLRDGVPIYLTSARGWSPAIEEALLVEESEAEALLAQAQEGPPPLPVIAPVLIEAIAEDGQVRPLTLRERIRAFGPTV